MHEVRPTSERPRLTCRAVLVDDNELTRVGFAEALRSSPEIELVGSIGHAEGTAWASEWADVDVVIVDAADEGAVGDQFPGVQVVRRIRSCQGHDHPTVIVVTGHFMNDGLRHRMAEANADFFFLRAELRSIEVLHNVVLHPERYRRGVPAVQDQDTPRLLGITGAADVEQLVRYIDDHELHEAFGHGTAIREGPRSRSWIGHRGAIAGASNVEPRNVTTGDIPREGQRWPSLRQLSRIYRWAARVQRSSDNG